MTLIDDTYRACIDRMAPWQRVERSMAMLQWSRTWIAREIERREGPQTPERLKWKVALHMYRGEPDVRKLIERELARVST
ncbi:MAG: hypothetical protein H6834_09665 [Planctomycetes bacterium]|nr:hypothetical protein [Planctomycetota bacterium]